MDARQEIIAGNTCLGIEFGSTNIKAVLTGSDYSVLASGSHRWVSHVEDGYFSYSQEEIISGLQDAYAQLKTDVRQQYGETLTKVGCIGISAMMHGYLAFDRKDKLLVPFRTWQNTTTSRAAGELSELFAFNIPERWSIAHLYQAMLNREAHIEKIAWITTLAGYVHYLLTGAHVLGIGDASGMFPIDSAELCYDQRMLRLFADKPAQYGCTWTLEEVLPKVLLAGEDAGALTTDGAALLDIGGDLAAGIPFCPPEGDAGTGMTATNSVRENTGNVSAGTSIFSMVVLDKPLKSYYKEIDVVATPTGKAVAMVHCNNCTNDMNAWAGVLEEFVNAVGLPQDAGESASPEDVAASSAVSTQHAVEKEAVPLAARVLQDSDKEAIPEAASEAASKQDGIEGAPEKALKASSPAILSEHNIVGETSADTSEIIHDRATALEEGEKHARNRRAGLDDISINSDGSKYSSEKDVEHVHNSGVTLGSIYETIYRLAASGDADCGGTVVCNYIAGEPVTGAACGFPLVYRDPEKPFKLANLCRAFLYSAIVSLKIGMDVLKNEDIRIDRLIGHGGLFKNGDVGARFLASALHTPVNVMETAEVGGPYGMALLARYRLERMADMQDAERGIAYGAERGTGQGIEQGAGQSAGRGAGQGMLSLEDYLEQKVFRNVGVRRSEPCASEEAGIDQYTRNFKSLLQRVNF